MEDCIFCKIIRGDISGDVVLEDEDFLAIRDISPKAPQHVLVMPREHIPSLNEIGVWTDGRGQRLLAFMVRAAEALGISESGYRVITNVGADGGQQVGHLHFHVMGGETLGDLP